MSSSCEGWSSSHPSRALRTPSRRRIGGWPTLRWRSLAPTSNACCSSAGKSTRASSTLRPPGFRGNCVMALRLLRSAGRVGSAVPSRTARGEIRGKGPNPVTPKVVERTGPTANASPFGGRADAEPDRCCLGNPFREAEVNVTAVNELTDTSETTGSLQGAAAGIVEALVRALELHDYRRGSFGESAAHTSRVATLACLLTELVLPELAGDPGLEAGFRLHDIGMIGIPAHVLSKPGPLTADELSEIREHPWLGERIVAPVDPLNGLARRVLRRHHERRDGTG